MSKDSLHDQAKRALEVIAYAKVDENSPAQLKANLLAVANFLDSIAPERAKITPAVKVLDDKAVMRVVNELAGWGAALADLKPDKLAKVMDKVVKAEISPHDVNEKTAANRSAKATELNASTRTPGGG